VPAEEAREDVGAKQIHLQVYKYKVSLCKGGKEQQQLELVQKQAKIEKFHCLYYILVLGCGRYHMTSYKLATQCWHERRAIMAGSISTHRDYGERLGLSFN
jgi:hypothetical protein